MRAKQLLATIATLSITLGTGGVGHASGGGPTGPSYVDVFGGGTEDLNRFYDGKVGVVTASSPRSRLFMVWRLLHRLPVGPVAGPPLSIPCCDSPDPSNGQASWDWIKVRKDVPGAAELSDYIQMDRAGPDDSSIPNCFAEAFATAIATLQDRIKSYGATSPWVKAWLDGQDAVFGSCGKPVTSLPVLDSAAPAWLKADHAYQAAALALYKDQNVEAAADFAAIGKDTTSPWRPKAAYLVARSFLREAIERPSPTAFAAADKAIAALQATPAGTFGQSTAKIMAKVIGIRERPDAARAALEAELNGPTIGAEAATDFRDYVDLNVKTSPPPQILDWIRTIKATAPGGPEVQDNATPEQHVAQQKAAVSFALAHAQARWAATHDVAWLVAALALAGPADPAAPDLVAEAAKLDPASPAYVAAAYQRLRLTIRGAPAAESRAALDQLLARTDLSATDRNLFIAERLQVAEDLPAFAKLALRHRLCSDETPDQGGCTRNKYNEEGEAPGIYDATKSLGLGLEARALIDRMPLAQRAQLGQDPNIPADLRLDIALTSWTRAVMLRDEAQVAGLATQLKVLLPLLATDLARVAATPPGPDRRFAAFFVMAKIPGLAPDLETYTRPTGPVKQFQGHWLDWEMLPAGATNGNSAPPDLGAYYPDGSGGALPDGHSTTLLGPTSDLVCLGYCGAGAFPLRRPDFAAAGVARAAQERRQMSDQAPQPTTPDGPTPPPPAGAISVWEEVFSYASAHPKDPRSPEALYWLGHVSHYGKTHGHVGHRAFDLLQQRYPTTTWAKQTKYYYD
ncbi:MAG TPA: hypothetical protein VGI95_14220 [Caulobacteraceae bacterium]|jgi:hypothetical protein